MLLVGLAITVVVLATAVNAETDVSEGVTEMYGRNPNSEMNDKNDLRGHVSKRAAVSNESLLWPNRRINYTFEDDFDQDMINNITTAIEAWSNVTCLEFVKIDESTTFHYVIFKSGPFCDSDVGYRQMRGQIVELTDDCIKESGTLIHLIGRAIGLWPETSRPDRDNYIKHIFWDNILSNKREKFYKRNDSEIDYQGIAYDYSSIMHYSTTYYNNCIECETFNPDYNMYMNQTLGNESAIAPS